MKLCLRIVLLIFLVTGTLSEGGFDLSDAIDDDITTAKPKGPPKASEKPKTNGELDLLDAFGPGKIDLSSTQKPKKPNSGDSGGIGFDLNDAVGPDTNPKPDKPDVYPPKSGEGGGSFDDSDLVDVSGGDYKPDRTGGGKVDPGHDPQGGADQPQAEGSGPIAGIVSAIGVALVGAASSYFAYQKKKLCFKFQGGADPESGKGQHGAQSDPQVFSDLLRNN